MAETPCDPATPTHRHDAPRVHSALPSPDQALAVYRLTSRLVERQLELAERGHLSPVDVADARDMLVGTREMLLAALSRVDLGQDATADGQSLWTSDAPAVSPEESAERRFASPRR